MWTLVDNFSIRISQLFGQLILLFLFEWNFVPIIPQLFFIRIIRIDVNNIFKIIFHGSVTSFYTTKIFLFVIIINKFNRLCNVWTKNYSFTKIVNKLMLI